MSLRTSNFQLASLWRWCHALLVHTVVTRAALRKRKAIGCPTSSLTINRTNSNGPPWPTARARQPKRGKGGTTDANTLTRCRRSTNRMCTRRHRICIYVEDLEPPRSPEIADVGTRDCEIDAQFSAHRFDHGPSSSCQATRCRLASRAAAAALFSPQERKEVDSC